MLGISSTQDSLYKQLSTPLFHFIHYFQFNMPFKASIPDYYFNPSSSQLVDLSDCSHLRICRIELPRSPTYNPFDPTPGSTSSYQNQKQFRLRANQIPWVLRESQQDNQVITSDEGGLEKKEEEELQQQNLRAEAIREIPDTNAETDTETDTGTDIGALPTYLATGSFALLTYCEKR